MDFSCPFCGCQNEGPASCKWWSGGTSLLQMVIWRGRPLANDDPEGLASCRWSSGGAGPLQMMIRTDRPLEKGHPKGAGLLQMIIWRAAAVRGGIGDFSSWMKIGYFLCKIRFRTQKNEWKWRNLHRRHWWHWQIPTLLRITICKRPALHFDNHEKGMKNEFLRPFTMR